MINSIRCITFAAAALLVNSPAWADMQSCLKSDVRSGSSSDNGVTIQFNDFVAGVTPDLAFDRIYRAASNKFDVSTSDRQTRTIAANAQMKKAGGLLGQLMQTSDMSYKMTFNIDPAPGGSNVTLVVKFRQGISVGRGGGEEQCEVIQAAQNVNNASIK